MFLDGDSVEVWLDVVTVVAAGDDNTLTTEHECPVNPIISDGQTSLTNNTRVYTISSSLAQVVTTEQSGLS